jgi:hypothetical protein
LPRGAVGLVHPFAHDRSRREKDIPDRMFLRQLLAAQGIQVEETPPPQPATGLRA